MHGRWAKVASTLLELATAVAPKAFAALLAEQPGADQLQLELLLLQQGYADDSEVPDEQRYTLAHALAHQVVLAAIDIARAKVKKAKAGPTEAEFRDELKYLEALAKRLARKAGIDDTGEEPDDVVFAVSKAVSVPPSTPFTP